MAGAFLSVQKHGLLPRVSNKAAGRVMQFSMSVDWLVVVTRIQQGISLLVLRGQCQEGQEGFFMALVFASPCKFSWQENH